VTSVESQPEEIVQETLSQKKKKSQNRVGGVAIVIKPLSSKSEA
jgi:hypothetical protein